MICFGFAARINRYWKLTGGSGRVDKYPYLFDFTNDEYGFLTVAFT
jgi:hypothetical protein